MLFKVCTPRADWWFDPRPFWRSPDWKSSTTRPREGYIAEQVVYAGEFDEVNIHLFPLVRRIRVWLTPASRPPAAAAGLVFGPDDRAAIALAAADRATVEAFHPTIYTFTETGFEPVPSNEYICRSRVRPVARETLPIAEAIRRWQIAVNYLPALDPLIVNLIHHGVAFSEQS